MPWSELHFVCTCTRIMFLFWYWLRLCMFVAVFIRIWSSGKDLGTRFFRVLGRRWTFPRWLWGFTSRWWQSTGFGSRWVSWYKFTFWQGLKRLNVCFQWKPAETKHLRNVRKECISLPARCMIGVTVDSNGDVGADLLQESSKLSQRTQLKPSHLHQELEVAWFCSCTYAMVGAYPSWISRTHFYFSFNKSAFLVSMPPWWKPETHVEGADRFWILERGLPGQRNAAARLFNFLAKHL